MRVLDVGNAELNCVQLATGIGLEAAQPTTLKQRADLLRQSLNRSGPALIELVV